MHQLSLAFDSSSSQSKGFYDTGNDVLQLITMEPDVVSISPESLELQQNNQVGVACPENDASVAWSNHCFAVGFLAQSQLYSFENLKTLKYETVVPKVMAMIGAIAQKNRLPSIFELELGVLLPYGEYQDRLKLQSLLERALSKFTFRKKTYQVNLKSFHCFPEGAGVLLRGALPNSEQTEKSILVVMLGYRNISYLLLERGQLTRGETEDLGFSWLIEQVKKSTSGFKGTDLIVPITQAGKKVKKSEIKPLLKSEDMELRKLELAEIIKAVEQARKQHIEIILKWLYSRKFSTISEVIIAGGTADYYREELENFFKKQSSHWASSLEEQVKELVGLANWSSQWKYRLTDVYGYYFYLKYRWSKNSLLKIGVRKNASVS